MKVQPRIACLIAALSLPLLGHAACGKQATIFACTVTNGKVVEVCDAGKTISYAFGRKGEKPEMALSIPRDQASTSQWQGIGRHMSYSVLIPNGDTVYEVFSSVDKHEQALTQGIHVEVKGKPVATLKCKSGTAIDNLEGVDLPPA